MFSSAEWGGSVVRAKVLRAPESLIPCPREQLNCSRDSPRLVLMIASIQGEGVVTGDGSPRKALSTHPKLLHRREERPLAQ